MCAIIEAFLGLKCLSMTQTYLDGQINRTDEAFDQLTIGDGTL